MKKLIGFFILPVLTVGLLGAASVTVTKPAANETWVKGQTYAITWTKSGDMPPNVKITLRDKNSTTDVLQIVDPTPNSGSYHWLVPANVPDGQYRVRVKVKTVPVLDDSEIFNIASQAAASITVTKPTTGDKWNKNKTYSITWTKDGTMPNTVTIDLMNQAGTTVVKAIKNETPNSGSYAWLVPTDVAFGQYRVRVQVKTTEIKDDSEIFAIAVPQVIPAGGPKKEAAKVQPYLKVVFPADDAACRNGEHLYIRFKAYTMPDDAIDIDLYNESMSQKLMDIHSGGYGPGTSMPPRGPDYPNEYIYDWIVPFGDVVAPGYFKIWLHSLGKNITAWSGRVYITWPMREKEYLFDATVKNIHCINSTQGLDYPPRPSCEEHWNYAHAMVGFDVFDHAGTITWEDGEVHPYWRIYIHHSQLRFPIEQFQGKKVKLIQAKLNLKKECTAAVNSNLGSCAGRLHRLDAAPPAGPTGPAWYECQAMQKTTLVILPSDLTEKSFFVTQTVEYWINGTIPNYGFLLSVADETPPNATVTCVSGYTAKLYIKIEEEYKGYE